MQIIYKAQTGSASRVLYAKESYRVRVVLSFNWPEPLKGWSPRAFEVLLHNQSLLEQVRFNWVCLSLIEVCN